jgi:hypothetical protein
VKYNFYSKASDSFRFNGKIYWLVIIKKWRSIYYIPILILTILKYVSIHRLGDSAGQYYLASDVSGGPTSEARESEHEKKGGTSMATLLNNSITVGYLTGNDTSKGY